jgi:FkbM family methyltransferase
MTAQFKPLFFGTVNRMQRFLSRSRLAVRSAAKVRNQCNRIIAFSLATTPDRRHNGEELLAQTVGPRISSFIDVGANVGDWTDILLSASGGKAAGLLLEPGVGACARLRDRLGDKLGPNLKLMRVAASDREGSATFYEELEAGETSSLVSGASRGSATAVEVTTVTLDALLEGMPGRAVDFLKIDAEGFDGRILAGAAKAFADRRIGIVQFEYNAPWRRAGTTLENACAELSSKGYVVRVLTRGGLRRFDLNAVGEFFDYANFVAVSPVVQADRTHPIHTLFVP